MCHPCRAGVGVRAITPFQPPSRFGRSHHGQSTLHLPSWFPTVPRPCQEFSRLSGPVAVPIAVGDAGTRRGVRLDSPPAVQLLSEIVSGVGRAAVLRGPDSDHSWKETRHALPPARARASQTRSPVSDRRVRAHKIVRERGVHAVARCTGRAALGHSPRSDQAFAGVVEASESGTLSIPPALPSSLQSYRGVWGTTCNQSVEHCFTYG
jgi:hypothetical protein